MKNNIKWRVLIVIGMITILLRSLVIVSGGLVNQTLAAEPAGVWVPAGQLTTGRHSHTVTKLPDGKILAAGGTQGFFEGTGLRSTEVYNPESNVWTPAASLNQARQSHTATRLTDGRVLVAGGRDGFSYLASIELYDPFSQRWTLTTPLNTPRTNHAAVLLKDGRVMIIGGVNLNDGDLASVEIFNPADNSVSLTTPMNRPRNNHSAVLLEDGRVLVTGGYDQGWLAAGEIYNPATESWTITNPIFCHGVDHSATLLSEGSVLIAGGACGSGYPGVTDKAEIFNPTTNSWQAVDPLPRRIYAHTATLLPDNKVLAAGGSTGQTRLATAQFFNPAAGTWTPIASLHTERRHHAAVLLDNGDALVVGGWSSSTSQLDSAEIYPATHPEPSGSISLINQANQDAVFHFSGDLGDFSLPTAGSRHFANLSPGGYTMTEAVNPGWRLVGVQCITAGPDSPDYNFEPDVQRVTIQVMANQDVICVLTNERPTSQPEACRLYLPLIFKPNRMK